LLEQHARVARVDRGHVTLLLHGEPIRVATDLPLAVGDRVRFQPPAGLELLPRSSELVRRAAGSRLDHQVLAANVDQALIVQSLDRPLNTRRLQRFAAIAWDGGVEPVVVLSKIDLDPDWYAAVGSAARAVPGTPVIPVSAHTGEGVDELLALAGPGVTLVLVGQSGSGKSTIVNALLGEQRMATGDVRGDGKGRHTTTHRELLDLPGGGTLIDTPGIRGLALWDSAAGVERAFADIGELADRCRFRDCRHRGEPGCAVQGAIDAGELDPVRLDDHHRLERELAALERRRDPRLQAEQRRGWRAMERSLRQHYRMR
jgi:ribosome biogenesis GTPase / thiamine phosphate phosphatase